MLVSLAQQMQDLQRQSTQLCAPRPIEALGAGARWEVINRLDTGGMELLQRALYAVSSISDAGAESTAAIEQRLVDGSGLGDSLPPEMGGQVVEMRIGPR
jgi:hypothetical protein